MKTTSVILFATLAAVLLASANVDAGDACYNHFGGQPRQQDSDKGASLREGDLCEMILCLINLFTTGDVNLPSILKCLGLKEPHSIPVGLSSRKINFEIMNERSVSDDGMIMNAWLSCPGKWQLFGQDVNTINNIGFDRNRTATFAAMVLGNSPSDTEGSFEIHESGKKIADIKFSVPFWDEHRFYIQILDKKYQCPYLTHTSSGSLFIKITCHKISNDGIPIN